MEGTGTAYLPSQKKIASQRHQKRKKTSQAALWQTVSATQRPRSCHLQTHCPAYPAGATIVLENLKNIRDTSKMGRGKQKKNVENKRRLHSWSFDQLYSFVEYKAQERGIQVIKVDPRHTSQTCSLCGHQHRSNRRSQSLFLCRSCGYSLNADLNAAYNIRDKYCLAQDGTPVLSGPTCQAAYRVDSQESDASPRALTLSFPHILQTDFVKEPGKTIAIVEIDVISALAIPLSSDLPKMWVRISL